jgi:quercetin dioxygenase-like cupin family protein
MKATTPFIEDANIAWETLDPFIRRKVMGYDSQLMMVRVEFRKGGIGALHHHPHSQITHIESGIFDVSIGSESRRLRAGDAYYIPPDVVHGATCVEDGVLVDVFSPMREDLV